MIEDEPLRALVNAEIFKGLTQDEVELFYDASQRVTFEKAATLIEKGQTGEQIERRMSKVQLSTQFYKPMTV